MRHNETSLHQKCMDMFGYGISQLLGDIEISTEGTKTSGDASPWPNDICSLIGILICIPPCSNNAEFIRYIIRLSRFYRLGSKLIQKPHFDDDRVGQIINCLLTPSEQAEVDERGMTKARINIAMLMLPPDNLALVQNLKANVKANWKVDDKDIILKDIEAIRATWDKYVSKHPERSMLKKFKDIKYRSLVPAAEQKEGALRAKKSMILKKRAAMRMACNAAKHQKKEQAKPNISTPKHPRQKLSDGKHSMPTSPARSTPSRLRGRAPSSQQVQAEDSGQFYAQQNFPASFQNPPSANVDGNIPRMLMYRDGYGYVPVPEQVPTQPSVTLMQQKPAANLLPSVNQGQIIQSTPKVQQMAMAITRKPDQAEERRPETVAVRPNGSNPNLRRRDWADDESDDESNEEPTTISTNIGSKDPQKTAPRQNPGMSNSRYASVAQLAVPTTATSRVAPQQRGTGASGAAIGNTSRRDIRGSATTKPEPAGKSQPPAPRLLLRQCPPNYF